MTLDQLIERAIERNASDILMSPGHPPALRVNGVLSFTEDKPLADDVPSRTLHELMTPAQLSTFEAERSFDFALERRGRRFRCSAYHTNGLPGLSLRVLPISIPTPEKLGLPKAVSDLVHRPHGLILVSGATGQGKSTTQASLLDVLNRQGPRLIITLEDPIEYKHQKAKAVVDQRELGRDITSFADALRQLVRQRPDVVMLGEMRDDESIRSTLTLAESGHLVFSTIHTADAVQSVTRIVESFAPQQQAMIRSQLAAVLLGVVNQRLVHGLKGELVLAVEVLLSSPAVAAIIRDGHFAQLYGQMELEQHLGSQTINQALARLVAAHVISAAEAAHHVHPSESRSLRLSARGAEHG